MDKLTNIDISKIDLTTLEKIGEGGSDRSYFRGRDFVVMSWGKLEDDSEILRQVELTQLFITAGIQVPAILAVDTNNKIVIMEDVGDTHLSKWILDKEPEVVLDMLKKVIDGLVKIHSLDYQSIELMSDRLMNQSVFRWQTSYFMKWCVLRSFKRDLSKNEITALDEEFDSLARKMSLFSEVFVHKDFQSENIMVFNNEPRFIDFQDARTGPGAYDLVSILKDPYMDVESFEEELYSYYVEKMSIDNERDFRREYILSSMQRHMQALGSYCFLSEEKDLLRFVEFIKPTLSFLCNEIPDYEFPNIKKLSSSLLLES